MPVAGLQARVGARNDPSGMDSGYIVGGVAAIGSLVSRRRASSFGTPPQSEPDFAAELRSEKPEKLGP